jgi:hypothetical protein
VQNQSLSILSAKTGLTSSPIDLTSVPGAQIGLTDPPTGQTGLAIPDNPILENSASNGLEHDKADAID